MERWAIIIMKRLAQVVAALNVLVLVLLVVLKSNAGGDVAADASAAEIDAPTAPTTAAPEPITNAGGNADPVDTAVLPAVEAAVDQGLASAAQEDVPAAPQEPPAFPAPWEPTANEVQAEAKTLGTAAAYAITNYEADTSLNDLVATLPAPDPELADAMLLEVQTVHHPGMWSRGTVEYAQLGGHLNGRISIIVVVRQQLGFEGSSQPDRIETRTMEVRFAQDASGTWRFETIASGGGQPVERPADLSPLAAAVVDHELIDLPDTGVWDTYAGYIDPALLQVMLDLADRTPYSVVVLRTGHSYNVFETNRVSRHSVGKAVDIYMLGSDLMVDSHDLSSDSYALSEWLVMRDDIKEFGSPWRFPDAVVHTFTNEVHHDHAHIGVYGG